MSQNVGANQVTAEGGESLAAKSEFTYLKYHATTHAPGDCHRKWHNLICKILGLRQTKIGVRIVVTAGR